MKALVEKDPEPNTEDGDKLSILSTLVENYEANLYPDTPPNPVDAIIFRMEQADLKPAEPHSISWQSQQSIRSPVRQTSA